MRHPTALIVRYCLCMSPAPAVPILAKSGSVCYNFSGN